MDSAIYVITALLPLAAVLLLTQSNPYHALVMRGILGAVAALTYTVLGAPDVALTEALVGTLLAILLYAVAVRSSMVLRLGVLEDELLENITQPKLDPTSKLEQLLKSLRQAVKAHYLQVELLPYANRDDLQRALAEKAVHAICTPWQPQPEAPMPELPTPYVTTIRLQRLYDIIKSEIESEMHQELTPRLTQLRYQPTPALEESH